MKGGDTMELTADVKMDKIDRERFFADGEEECFDCERTGIVLFVVSKGVALCASCLENDTLKGGDINDIKTSNRNS